MKLPNLINPLYCHPERQQLLFHKLKWWHTFPSAPSFRGQQKLGDIQREIFCTTGVILPPSGREVNTSLGNGEQQAISILVDMNKFVPSRVTSGVIRVVRFSSPELVRFAQGSIGEPAGCFQRKSSSQSQNIKFTIV